MPLYLTEQDVAELLTPADAVEAIEACFRRMAAGSVENRPRYRLGLEEGALAVMAAADLELGYAGAKVYAGFRDGARFAVLLFRADSPELVAVLEADKLGQLRTGAASGVAARHLAAGGATSLGLIGCGWQAESQLACIRAAVPRIERVVAYCRTEERLRAFCEEHGAEPGESHQDPAACDVVVTATTSRDPVLRGEWLRAGALVCAVGANDGRRRELDNVVLERSAFVCCDSVDDAKLESADLIEPVESGVLDWLEVHELQEVVAGEVAGRQSHDDIVVFKSNGLAAWDVAVAAAAVERARVAGAGREVS
jgi:ornithine cyclodeaminase/alanine dehydrogenase